MKSRISFILVCCLFSFSLSAQEIDPERKVSIIYKDTELNQILVDLSEREGLYFTYFTTLPALQTKITCNIRNIPLKSALEELFRGTNITFHFYGNNIILKGEAKNLKKKYPISGTILDSETKLPISYASIQVKNTYLGTIANQQGEFQLTVLSDKEEDTLTISSMGYMPVVLLGSLLSQKGAHKIYLTPKTFALPLVKVSTEQRIIKEMGNFGKVSFGSLFMDTHGQQTAVLVDNKRGVEGKVKSVNYYLTGKADTEAPFRVRVYAVDTLTGEPGTDLLTDVLVVTPGEAKGWYSVDLYDYDIHIPKIGMFIAMEGLYPNDYEFYQDGSDFIDISGMNSETDPDNVINTKEYGQRLGYNKRGPNNTWHYSIDHKWYQIDKRYFNAMISLNIITKQKSGKSVNFEDDEESY